MSYEATVWSDGENNYNITDQEGNVLFANVKFDFAGATGTPLSATNMNKIENGIANSVGMVSYLAFCANVNATSLDAAFGKNNTDKIINIGEQLAMYAWFKGASKVTYPFTNLITKNTFAECLSDPNSLIEILLENNYIIAIINASPFAKALYDAAIVNDASMGKVIAIIAGLDPDDYVGMAALAANATAIGTVIGNSTAMEVISRNAFALNVLAKSSTAKTALLANITAFNAIHNTMLATLDASPTLFTKTSVGATPSANPSGATFTLGAAPSFVDVVSMNDGNTTGYWSTLKHLFSAVEIVHPAFPSGAGTGLTTINKFGIDGAVLYSPNVQNGMAYVATRYTAL